jgi:hypothetical protein
VQIQFSEWCEMLLSNTLVSTMMLFNIVSADIIRQWQRKARKSYEVNVINIRC